MDAQRQLLEELMGLNAAALPSDPRHPSVCKHSLLGFCPHEVLGKTKYGLGPCPRIHAQALVDSWETAGRPDENLFERELLRELEVLIARNDREIAKGNARVDEDNKSGPGSSGGSQPDTEKAQLLEGISRQIEKLLADAEKAGEEGEVEKSQKLLEEAEALKQQKKTLSMESSTQPAVGGLAKPKVANFQQLRVCPDCGSFLSLLDSDERLQDHFNGRVHIGWAQTREKAKALRSKLQTGAGADARGVHMHPPNGQPAGMQRAGWSQGQGVGAGHDRYSHQAQRGRFQDGRGYRDNRDWGRGSYHGRGGGHRWQDDRDRRDGRGSYDDRYDDRYGRSRSPPRGRDDDRRDEYRSGRYEDDPRDGRRGSHRSSSRSRWGQRDEGRDGRRDDRRDDRGASGHGRDGHGHDDRGGGRSRSRDRSASRSRSRSRSRSSSRDRSKPGQRYYA